MNRKFFVPVLLLSAGIFLAGCYPKTDGKMEQSVIQAKVDSLAAIRIDSANSAISAACNLHFADKVNALADSLVSVAQAHSSK